MSFLLESPSWILASLFVVIPSVLICLCMLWAVRKWIPAEELRENHDVAGFTFGIIGVLYSVILGFTVVNVQNRYNDVLQTIHIEAVALADLYRDAASFSPANQNAIRTSLRNYVDYVVKQEWELPTKKGLHMDTEGAVETIWTSYHNIELRDEKMNIWYTESLSKLNNFMSARLSRQFSSWEHLGNMMWSILIIGGLITICFMFFFGLEKLRTQMIMTALLAGYISFMLYLVYSLDHVFKGPEGIKPVAFEQVVTLFDRLDRDS